MTKLQNSETRFGEVEECKPENFVKFLEKISNIFRMSRQVIDEFTGETRWESNRPNIGVTDEQFQDFVNLLARFKVCKTHVDFHTSKFSNKKLEKVCNHSVNCSKGGCHIFEGVKQICFENLCGIPCGCDSTNDEEMKTKLNAIQLTIDALKLDLDKSTDPRETNRLTLCIEKYVKDLVECHPKIHLGQKLVKPNVVVDTSNVTFDNVLKSSQRFEFNDPEFTEFMKTEIERKKVLSHLNMNASKIANAFRSYKFKNLKMKMSLTNPEHLEYLSSGAFFVGLSLERFMIVKEEFTNWSKYWRNLSYQEFHSFVLKKTEIWNSLGTVTHLEDDVIVEVHVPSEKDDYLNFWSWIRNIPHHKDPHIIEGVKDVVMNAYDLFLLYKEEYSTFAITFSEWINLNPSISKAVDLMRNHSVTYTCAKRYIEMDVSRSGMSVVEFSRYNPKMVNVWMKINHELPFLGMGVIDIDTFIRDEEYYVEYILSGWWIYYEKKDVGGFSKYISDKQNNWKFTPLKVTYNPSVQKSRDEKLKADEELKAHIKAHHDEIAREKAQMKKLRMSRLAALRASRKKVKPESDSDSSDSDSSDSDSDSSDSDSSDSDSDSEVDFNFNVDDMLNEEFTKSVQKLNSKMHVPSGSLYFFRTQTDRGTHDIYIGPFESEEKAKEVVTEMKVWNKNGGSRTMKPRIEKDDDSGMLTSWNIVFGDTSNNRRNDKKESRGVIPYDWVPNMIVHLCNTCLSGVCVVSQFCTNITCIDSLLKQAKTTPTTKIVPAYKVQRVSKVVTPKVVALAPKVETPKIETPKVVTPKVVAVNQSLLMQKKVLAFTTKSKLPFARANDKDDDYSYDWDSSWNEEW